MPQESLTEAILGAIFARLQEYVKAFTVVIAAKTLFCLEPARTEMLLMVTCITRAL